MKKNISQPDKIIRVVVAVLLVIIYLTLPLSKPLGIILLAVAGILILTVFMNFCPIYFLLHISTCKKNGPAGEIKDTGFQELKAK